MANSQLVLCTADTVRIADSEAAGTTYVSTVPNQAGQSCYAHCSSAAVPRTSLFFPLINVHACYLRTVALRAAQRWDVAPGTRDPDPPAKKSVSTSVKGVYFAEQKGAG